MYFIWNRRVGDGRDTIPVLSAERKPADVALKDWLADVGPVEELLFETQEWHALDRAAAARGAKRPPGMMVGHQEQQR